MKKLLTNFMWTVLCVLSALSLVAQTETACIDGNPTISLGTTNTYCIGVDTDGISWTWMVYGDLEIIGDPTGECIEVLSKECGTGLIELIYCVATSTEANFSDKGSSCKRCILEVKTPIEDCCTPPSCPEAPDQCDGIEVRPINPGYPEGTLCVGNTGQVKALPLWGEVCWIIQPAGSQPTDIDDFVVFPPFTMPDPVTIVVETGSILDFAVSGEGSWTVVAQFKDCEGNITATCGTVVTAVKCPGIDGDFKMEIDVFDAPQSMHIFPNPVDDSLNISVVGTAISNGQIAIHAINGALLERIRVDASDTNAQIDVSGYAEGTYYISYHTERDGMVTKEFVVQH